MKFNYTSEKKKFDREQEQLAKQYREAGMGEDAIQEMYQYDYELFKKQRVFCQHNQYLDIDSSYVESERSSLLAKFMREMSTEMTFTKEDERYSWIEDVIDEHLYEVLHNFTEADLEIITMLVIEGYSVVEVARLKGVTHQAVSKKWKKIQKKFIGVVAD